jgi:hypothetical protein
LGAASLLQRATAFQRTHSIRSEITPNAVKLVLDQGSQMAHSDGAFRWRIQMAHSDRAKPAAEQMRPPVKPSNSASRVFTFFLRCGDRDEGTRFG